MEDEIAYCVTGATGYIGSWLVRALLQRGFRVHATARDPGDRLRLVRADLQEEGSFDEAVKGCTGVFHVAAPMQFDVPPKEDVEGYVCANIIEPAINGTVNLLKSCLKAASVKRVVFTSSISTITAKDTAGKWTSVVDESCQESVDHVWRAKASGWVYVLSKILTEEAAFQFAKEKGIDLLSVITTTVAGPFLTSTVPSSIKVLLSPVTGDPKFSSILAAVNLRMGSIALVHIEDICSAHIFLMEHPRAKDRYMCCAGACSASELVDHLAKAYPFSVRQRLIEVEQGQEEGGSAQPEISSKKLTALGFDFKYKLEDIISQAVNPCVDCGFLCPTTRNGFEVET